MPAEPTTPGDQHHGRSSRLSQLIVLCAVAAVPLVASSVAAADQEVSRDSANLTVELGGTSSAVELSEDAVVLESHLATQAEPSGDDETAAGSDDSGLSGWAQLGILAAVAVVFLVVFGRRVVAVIDRRTGSWVDAWAKTVVIVAGIIVSVVIVPAKVLEFKTVQDMPRAAQDLITVGLWSGALAFALLALWYAHRERRI